jgi:hypothetical protein
MEAAFGQPTLERHLSTLKPSSDAAARAGILTFVATPAFTSMR